jgi:hypothetical protein
VLDELDDLARRVAARPGGFNLYPLAELANAYARAERHDEARTQVARLREVAAAYPAGSAAGTPRTVLGGPALRELVELVVVLDDPALAEEARAETKDVPFGSVGRAYANAAIAFLAADAAAAGRYLDGAYELARHVGFEAIFHDILVTFVREAHRRGVTLGTAWQRPIELTRAFAERVGAKWWLEVLAEAGV